MPEKKRKLIELVLRSGDMMAEKFIKMFAMMKRKSGLSRDEFIEHYEKVHAPLYLSFNKKNMIRYVRNYIRPASDGIECDYDNLLSYDVFTEFWFTEDGFANSMKNPISAAVMSADEESFIDRSASIFGFVEEYADDMSAYSKTSHSDSKHILLLKRKNDMSREAFIEDLKSRCADAFSDFGYVRNFFEDPVIQPVQVNKDQMFDFDVYIKLTQEIKEKHDKISKDGMITCGRSLKLAVDEYYSDI